MATLAISHATGATPVTYNLTSAVGERVALTVTMTNADGTARDCSGGSIRWAIEKRGAQGGPNYFELPGNDTGIHALTIPFSVTRLLDGTYQHDAWYRDSLGNEERVSATSSWVVSHGVGPIIDEPLNDPNYPPVVDLSAPTATVMQAGSCAIAFSATDDAALTAANFAVVVDGAATGDSVTLATGSGTTSVTGTASTTLTAGAHTVGIRCTDAGSETDTDTASLTAYSLTITSPTAGTYDEGTFAVTVAASPTVASGTVVTVYDGVSPVGTGTVGGGVTTSALTAGSHSLTARMTISGVTITSAAIVLTVADQDPTVTITSPVAGAQPGSGNLPITLTVTHPSASAASLTVQVSLNNSSWTTATHTTGNTWTATLSITSDPTTIYARAYDATPGGTVVSATPVTVNAAVTFTVTGSSWAGIFETANDATLTFTCTETAESTTDLTPSFTFAGAATRHIVMTCSTTPADVRTVVVGHLNSFDQHPTYNIGAAYNLAQQNVTAIANLSLLTGLQILACYQNPITALDLSSCVALRYVEAGLCTSLTSLVLPVSSTFIRCCFEQSALSAIDLEPVAPYIYDLRAAAQQGGALAVSHGGATFTHLDHWCTRDETVTFDEPMNWSTQLPAVRELWCWNCGLSGAFAPVSTALQSVQAYNNNFTSADFTDQLPTGRTCELLFADNELTGGITLTGCSGLATLDLQDCGLSRAQVDTVLTTMNGFATTNGAITIDGTNLPPTATGESAAQALEGRGWTVTREPFANGVDVDEFASELGAGWTSLLNTAAATWSANDGGSMVRTDSTGYAIYGNPGEVVTANSDYEVQTTVTGGTKAAGFFGLVGRWTGGDGVRCLFTDNASTCTVGQASGYATGNISLTEDATFPASWTNTGVSSTLRMRMVGTQISIYCDDVLVRHGTLSTNSTATGTYYGNCGEGGSTHIYQRMAVVTITA